MKWGGCIKIGVSGRDPGEVCSWIRAADPSNDKTGDTVVLSMTDGKPCLCAEGSVSENPLYELDMTF